jgi:hypothetical protein
VKRKLQRINIKEHHKQQHAVEQNGDGVLEAIAAEPQELRVPDLEQDREGNRKGQKSVHDLVELGGGSRRL